MFLYLYIYLNIVTILSFLSTSCSILMFLYLPHTPQACHSYQFLHRTPTPLIPAECSLVHITQPGDTDPITFQITKACLRKNAHFENFVFVISQLNMHPILKILVYNPHNYPLIMGVDTRSFKIGCILSCGIMKTKFQKCAFYLRHALFQ